MDEDIKFLKETLNLAKRAAGRTNPNPMVGALLVKGGKIIGTGYHRASGLPHAEIEALKECRQSPKGATLYVNLEPCAHFGKTPPCVDTIIRSNIKRVVCCTQDPNPKTTGLGAAKLQKMGLLFDVGLLENEARILNEAFFTFHEKKRPFIALKFAASLDGKIATRTGDSKWITNEKARKFARDLRGEYQAVLVGINTLLKDNPHLGDSLRIILDSTLKIPLNSNVLRDTNILIATTIKADKEKVRKLKQMGIQLLTFKETKVPIIKLLLKLRKREIISILVEGGGSVIGSFLDEQIIDKVYAFHAPIIIGGKKAVSAVEGTGVSFVKDSMRLKNISLKKFDDNLLIIGYTV